MIEQNQQKLEELRQTFVALPRPALQFKISTRARGTSQHTSQILNLSSSVNAISFPARRVHRVPFLKQAVTAFSQTVHNEPGSSAALVTPNAPQLPE